MHYRETGKRGKKVIPLTDAEGIHGRKMQWNTPFQACSSSSSLIVDTYCSVVVSNLGYFLPVLMWIPSRFDRIG